MRPPRAILRAPPASGAITVAAARADLHAARDRLQQQLVSVRRTLTQGPDWRAVARKHPLAVAIGAMAVGLVLAQLLRRR